MNPSDFSGVNFCTTSGLLTATGAETVHDTTVTIAFCVNGKALTKTAITDGATPTTDGVTGDAFTTLTSTKPTSGDATGQGCMYVWCLSAAGTVTIVEGEVTTTDSANNFVEGPEFPSIPDTLTPFAYQVCKLLSTSGTITALLGTSNWNATGFTNVITNIMTLPNRPQV